ncbi:hypothetical protein AAG570_002102 [Ranatra chinensis]|uniref:Uncharacterized protein n=1 Tax=Ranatra chinensis TaxID=642074 RepID=A0ABD0YUX9_9HEMI
MMASKRRNMFQKNKMQETTENSRENIVYDASVMVKLRHLIEVEHQLCFAHDIHLAVRDVLYKNNSSLVTVDAEIEPIEPQSSDCDSDVDDDNDIETDNEEDKKITDDGVVLELCMRVLLVASGQAPSRPQQQTPFQVAKDDDLGKGPLFHHKWTSL